MQTHLHILKKIVLVLTHTLNQFSIAIAALYIPTSTYSYMTGYLVWL